MRQYLILTLLVLLVTSCASRKHYRSAEEVTRSQIDTTQYDRVVTDNKVIYYPKSVNSKPNQSRLPASVVKASESSPMYEVTNTSSQNNKIIFVDLIDLNTSKIETKIIDNTEAFLID